MTLQELRDKMFNSKYENSIESWQEFENEFVEVWEDRFLETEEVFYLGRSVFNTAQECTVSIEAAQNELHRLCYGIFGFDLLGYYELIDDCEQEVGL